ncbi:MT-A70-domain-containing protein [Mycena indigotica]|uniref:MT-A70-domain-containing protein n=1 Tax=Mycena indigotica TaxID=2126181 RepID=A0A8H6W4I1_9AGAR|nr:MT-A70-domain-containing protein [Mycena indigotica]KAF7301488.1 MT-A70-domain-containing protein [Mycena indigotica]
MASDSEPEDDALDVEEDPEEYEQDDDEPDGVPDDVTEDQDDDSSDESEDGSEDEGDDSSEPGETLMDELEPPASASDTSSQPTTSQPAVPQKVPTPPPTIPPPRKRSRSPSPARIRKRALIPQIPSPRSYTVEAICALPHPVPTHALAASACMTHMITGSDDGYIRDYDIFGAVNGKNFLSAPQRHHAGVVEGIMKAGQLRFWWENPNPHKLNPTVLPEEAATPLPVYSLAMHSDALWTLAGSNTGRINLFTTRHEPGRCIHVMAGHREQPVSSLALDHEEKGYYSAGWDGDAIQWDLNTGYAVRNFTAHGAQLTSVAVRPISTSFAPVTGSSQDSNNTTLIDSSNPASQTMDADAKSDASFDPLFDDEPETPAEAAVKPSLPALPTARAIAHNAPPLLDSSINATLSPDILLTAAIDGQVMLWDRRVQTIGTGVGRLWMSDKTPPWCLSACWSADGGQIYAGRRNGTVDVWDTRQLGVAGPGSVPRLLKSIRNPQSSGVVSCVVAFPDRKHIATASIDNLRLWNVAEAAEMDGFGKHKSSGVQFKIIPGHHGGYISQMLVDPAARFLVSASSNRGWHGESTKTVFVHDIKRIQ